MTRGRLDKLDLLFAHCADLGVDVEWAQLGDHRRGHFECAAGRITLNLALTRAQAIATLAHEVAHAELGDRCSTPAVEERAWQLAAAMLVSPAEYAAAEDLVGHHLSALALELEVTPRLVEAWRAWWEQRGQHLERIASSHRVDGGV